MWTPEQPRSSPTPASSRAAQHPGERSPFLLLPTRTQNSFAIRGPARSGAAGLAGPSNSCTGRSCLAGDGAFLARASTPRPLVGFITRCRRAAIVGRKRDLPPQRSRFPGLDSAHDNFVRRMPGLYGDARSGCAQGSLVEQHTEPRNAAGS